MKPPTDDNLIDYNHTKSDVGVTKRDNNPLAKDIADINTSQDAKPYHPKYSLCDGLADAVFSSVLGELLLIIPFGIVAWVLITWGVVWLLIPLIVILLIIIKVIINRRTRKP